MPQEALDLLTEVRDRYPRYYNDNLEAKLPIFEIYSFHTTNKEYIENLIEDIKDKSVIPVIGAGLSHFKGADYPLWAEFLAQVFDRQRTLITDITPDGFDKMSCKEQASVLKAQLGPGIFASEVKSHFEDTDVSQDILKNQAIWHLPILFNKQIILTTNFDNLIKLVFGLHRDTSFKECSFTEIDEIEKKTPAATLLYKIHGSAEDFNRVILTGEDFGKAYKQGDPVYEGMRKVLQSKNVLFLGCGLEDRHEILEFYKDKDNSTTVYAIYPCENDDAKKAEIRKKLSNNGVTVPILYPTTDDHTHLSALLRFIARQFLPT